MAFDFLAGCLGGCAGILVSHPFDTIKVNLQTQNFKQPIYNGTIDCLQKIIAKDSVKGLYRGVSSPMGGVAFVNAIVFGVYGNINRHTNDPNSVKSHFIAGSIAGLVQSLICSPMELAKTRLQLQGNHHEQKRIIKHKGPLHCLKYIYKTEGYKGLFRGLGLTALRDVPGFSSYFVSYELLTRYTTPPTAFQTLIAGGLAGTISWLLTFPIDVIKSRIQADGLNGKRQYFGIYDCINKSYKEEGLSFCSRGLIPTLFRAFPMNAACFLVVSWIIRFDDHLNEIKLKFHKWSGTLQPQNQQQQQQQFFTGTGSLSFINNSTNDELNRRKLHTIKSLIFSSALNEAVCLSELIELINDLYDDYDFLNNSTTTTTLITHKGNKCKQKINLTSSY